MKPFNARAPIAGDVLWLLVFAAAMGFLEAIVVVYLRELFYPQGFGFPLVPIPSDILRAELVREAATLVMLFSLAAVSKRGFYPRLAIFLFAFGAWDVFYYVGLKAFLGWPPSLLTWDVLFLMPVAWLAPVLAPLINSLTMAAMGMLIMCLIRTRGMVKAGATAWVLILAGSCVIFVSYTWDYGSLILGGGFLSDFAGLPENERFLEAVSGHVPRDFNWPAFSAGEGMILLGMWLMRRGTLQLRF